MHLHYTLSVDHMIYKRPMTPMTFLVQNKSVFAKIKQQLSFFVGGSLSPLPPIQRTLS